MDNAAAELKKQNDIFGLIDDILDENNVFNDELKTEGIYIEGNLFDDTDQRDIKKIAEGKVSEINPPDNLLIVDLPDEDPINQGKTVSYDPVTNSICLASDKIKKKYWKQRKIGGLKQVNKKAAKLLKIAGFLDTHNLETINYNNTNLNYLEDETGMDTNLNNPNLDNIETIDLGIERIPDVIDVVSDALKKIKIISNSNRIRLASEKIKKKFQKQ